MSPEQAELLLKLIGELCDKVALLSTELAMLKSAMYNPLAGGGYSPNTAPYNPQQVPYTPPNQPYNPPNTNPFPGLLPDPCIDGGQHHYPTGPWGSTVPPSCQKCGKQAFGSVIVGYST